MKKILFILISGIIFTGCEPNEELYNKLDKEKEPYNENIEYTLTESDYSTMESLLTGDDTTFTEYIDDNSITEGFPVNDIVPLFLEDKFPALDKNSSAKITYNFIPAYLKKFDKNLVRTITENHYESLDFAPEEETGEPTDRNYFIGEEPNEFIPELLKDSILPFAPENTLVEVDYEYSDAYDNRTTTSSFYFLRNGKWDPLPNVYKLTDEDYLSINGITGDYFQSQSDADKYLPAFLENKFSYADEGDSKVLVYEISGNKNIRAKQYMRDSSGWYGKIKKTTPFRHSGKKWAFDPTVRYKLKEEDYAVILNYVKNDPDLSQYVDEEYDNTEYYYGASTYYVNFDTRIFMREDYQPEVFEGLSEEDANQIIFRRIVKDAVIMALQAQFPDAVPQVKGVDVHYEITFDAYDGNDDVWTVKYRCTAAGEPPQFEYIDGNTPYDEEGNE